MDRQITVTTEVHAPVQIVWDCYTLPEHITKWNHASDDWHSPRAENDVREGGKFIYRMEAKDGSEGFDFGGTYTEVVTGQKLAYTMDDGRKAVVSFEADGEATTVTVAFDPEDENPIEMQQQGWQAILDNFKTYTETSLKQG